MFSGDWKTLHTWNNGAASIQVGNAGGTVSGNQTINNWWPTNGANVSGVQPFKALVQNLALSQYTMYWQVGDGQLNQMYDSTQGAPHKEAMVDLGGWTWEGSGTYMITFVAKDGSGATIAQTSVQMHVVHY